MHEAEQAKAAPEELETQEEIVAENERGSSEVNDELNAVEQAESLDGEDQYGEPSQPFIGRWNRLVSSTNWEKGRIICQWRERLIQDGAPASEYSDEAWSRRVGSVTAQHVGRLRRVYQRFGDSLERYDGLYWSHFYAALDWEDAEMWLEGALQSKWSVSQMRRQRWKTLGELEAEPQPSEEVAAELDEDFEPALRETPQEEDQDDQPIRGVYDEIEGPLREAPDFGDEEDVAEADEESAERAPIGTQDVTVGESQVELVRPFEGLPELPEDLADAVESLKVAILRHKTEEWREVPCNEVLSALDALKALAVAPSSQETPF